MTSAASPFSLYTWKDFSSLSNGRPIYEPTREQVADRAHSVERAADNGGTFILDAEGVHIAYVPNSQSTEEGVWLYYSQTVREWLGI